MQVLSPWKNAEWSIFLFLDHSIIVILFSSLKVYFKAKQYLPFNSKGFLIINPCITLGNSPAADTEFCNSPYLWQIYLIRCPQGAAVCYKAGRIILSHLRKAGHKEKKKKNKNWRMINFVLATVYCWRVATHNSLLVHWKPCLLMYETWHTFQGWHQKASWNSEHHSTHQAYSPTPSGCFWKSSSSTDALQLPKKNPLEGKQTGAFHVFQWKQQWEITRNLLRVSEGIRSERKQKASAQPLFFFQNSFPWNQTLSLFPWNGTFTT